ncbi:hypothetical protein KP509_07G030400 [Ceratopteris richardii]|uniref:BZIP domain-containing protein n=1 Tax=Ceratopteris richardii TaxID=49495 RepID=A0A8T2UGH6_CERRI|nr:hypothetical protein KP509_07G030400 [Ceratopteris richardii]KAH7432605.1 hypothetical protein KP509_07G030400 [Ceratopteris richardii]
MVTRTMPSSAINGGFGQDLARQPSILSFTLDEFQNAIAEPGKPFGSMNMEEFVRNLWTAEESQAMAVAMASTTDNTSLLRQQSLQRLNSLSLTSALSKKTVEDVWKDIQRHSTADLVEGQHRHAQQQKNMGIFGEMTLEDFLVRAGALKNEADASSRLTGGDSNTVPVYSAGIPPPNVLSNSLPPSMNLVTCPNLPTDWMNFNSHPHQQMLQQAEAAAAAKRGLTPPSHMIPSGNSALYEGLGVLTDGPGLGQESNLSLSPAVSEYAMHGRKRYASEAVIEKTMERRQKRMIKNRESAARSRARKQAYTVELEAEVARLKQENERLKQQQALESRLPDSRFLQHEKVHVLRRVQSW